MAKFKETTYSVNDIALFLNRDYPYAATCWGQDMVGSERVPVSTVERWFKRYFPDVNKAQYLFRSMEATCIGHMEMA